MKNLIISLILLTGSQAMACLDPELKEIGENMYIEERATLLPNAGLQMNGILRRHVTKVIDLKGTGCSNKYIKTTSFLTKSGKLFHAVYTNEDLCDGGNSYGVVVNANLEVVADIHDGNFSCDKK
ncbi:hypothetical protein [Bdellovibrio sp. HCB337]|uniref:hypothetical protein n=1 Tax=Bdellovibrio sp. HCB337 TaxID=3394358 RepID=UPI0039A49B6C